MGSRARNVAYGVEGVELFIAYLNEKKQCCKVNGRISKIQDIENGVLHGPYLGPLLFLIYIIDFRLLCKEPRSQCMQMTEAFPIPQDLSLT